MVNTRAGGNGSNQGNDNNAPPPPPPPAEINMAQLLAMQAQMMQGIGQLTAVLQQAYQQQTNISSLISVSAANFQHAVTEESAITSKEWFPTWHITCQ